MGLNGRNNLHTLEEAEEAIGQRNERTGWRQQAKRRRNKQFHTEGSANEQARAKESLCHSKTGICAVWPEQRGVADEGGLRML